MPHVSRLLALVCLLTGSAVQAADPARYALLIGANHGNLREPTLRFAHADAHRLADVLTTMGDFLPDNVVTLDDPSADRVRDALARLSARMRTETSHLDDALLFVFYSGHADANALHLGQDNLPWNELRNSIVGSSAAVRLLVVDACRSGEVTRVKGVDVSAPFSVPESSRTVEGFALLSSAAAGESAQEAESVGGSFFSHHFVSGLRGAADTDHDGNVSLAEVYRYASDRTQASTAQTVVGVQHPTYAYGLKGHGDLLLTHIGTSRGLGTVHLPGAGQYFLWRDGRSGPLMAEADVDARGGVLRVPTGDYFVQQRLSDRMFEGTLAVQSDVVAEVRRQDLRAVTYDQWVRKGSGELAYAVSLWGGLGTAPLALQGYGPTVPLMVQGSLTLAQLTVDVQLQGTYAQAVQPAITGRLLGLGGAVGVRKMIDIDAWSVGFGARLGAQYMNESYDTQRLAPVRWSIVPYLDTLLRADWHFGDAWFIGAEPGLRVAVSRQGSSAQNLAWRFPVAFIGLLGVGYQW